MKQWERIEQLESEIEFIKNVLLRRLQWQEKNIEAYIDILDRLIEKEEIKQGKVSKQPVG